VAHRVVRTLLRLFRQVGKKVPGGIRIEMPITNRDFANMVGSSRETINRILGQMKKEQILETDRHGILIHDIHRLNHEEKEG